ncbi:bifunctional diguanylate cyclase/phosphodiesterase [Gluconobacter sp. LMG 31484]|uniref:Bifunctional diguanylate cyclase/phosphodiesterase n=1 Tax=Gluconobacter vitians TaxID=2728102 RepID=A0ABR9Y3L2_9PROT|nr:bifunctional diguanylate cyclase/phosphodiesterase [Gluconobacter vitians]MBF0858516.1 bifunctional diguanylate cyclase/phosphodiesterase [Gluconobacter vitians]
MALFPIHHLADAASEGLAVLYQGRIIEANRPLLSCIGTSLQNFPALRDILPGALKASPDNSYRPGVLRTLEGQTLHVQFRLTPLRRPDQDCLALAIMFPHAMAALFEASALDTATSLCGKDEFRKSLAALFGNGTIRQPAGILLHANINRFHTISERYGTLVAGQVLTELGQRLRTFLTDDCIIARLDNDEFGIFCPFPYAHPAQATRWAQIIRDVFHTTLSVAGHRIHVTASIGCCVIPFDTYRFETACHYAELALNEARRLQSSDWVRFNPVMQADIQHRSELEHDLQRALETNQFFLEFQPLICLKTNTVECVEALLRWQHPVKGVISPNEFIPIAEESGLIVPIGRWVLLEACAQASRLPEHIRVAVNISAVQFLHDDMYAAVIQTLFQTGLAANRLELELTESIFLDAVQRNLETMSKIRALGVKIVMDDFGIGFSSLNYLRSFPFDRIKIDRSFIRDMLNDPQAESIVSAIMTLGHAMSMEVVAEGVETAAQLDMLRHTSCSTAQGFLMGRPAPLADLTALPGMNG